MRIDKEEIISEFGLKPFGAKGWLSNKSIVCPECGKGGKFGINISDDGGGVHCFKCEYSESIFKYLNRIGRKDLIKNQQEFSLKVGIKKPIFEKEEEEINLPEIKLPSGFKRIEYDDYLENRNFKGYQYEEFQVGIIEHFLERKLHNYLIFVIKQNGKNVAWLARSKRSKKWHEQNIRDHKDGKCQLVLRYRNSENTDFDKIIGGFDEINENTHTVIVVEGLFDKVNISNIIQSEKYDEIKVIFTFGNKFSDNQIKLLRKTNVENVILMYDYKTIVQSKEYSLLLSRWFNVDVCRIDDEEIDPGNMDKKYFLERLTERKNFMYFYTNNLNKVL